MSRAISSVYEQVRNLLCLHIRMHFNENNTHLKSKETGLNTERLDIGKITGRSFLIGVTKFQDYLSLSVYKCLPIS